VSHNSSGSLQRERIGPVLVLTIDRPHVRNALDPETLDALSAEIEEARKADVRAIVLTGAGDVCFCAGMDLHALRQLGAKVGPSVRRFNDALSSFERPPLVAAVRGMSVGGGLEIMLRCDLVVAADNARFALPEVKHGLVPGGGGTLLPARIPVQIALEIGLLGDFFDAAQAASLGLINRRCPSDQVRDQAIELAQQLAERPPGTVRRIRELMWITALEGPTAGVAASGRQPDPDQAQEQTAGVARFTSQG
jgi:enoyl-CoA hydratase